VDRPHKTLGKARLAAICGNPTTLLRRSSEKVHSRYHLIEQGSLSVQSFIEFYSSTPL
jgi:hypothetical protein